MKHCCNTPVESNYCQHCGKFVDEIPDTYPVSFTTFIHGNKEDEEKRDLVEELKIPRSEAHKIYGIDYEVELEFIIDLNESGTLSTRLISAKCGKDELFENR
jgi:hypothetical protein